ARARADPRGRLGARSLDGRRARGAGLALLPRPGPGLWRQRWNHPRGHALLRDHLDRRRARHELVGARDGAAAQDGLGHPGPERDRVDLHRERGLDGVGALMRRALLPLVLAVLGLAGAGLATLSLHGAATTTVQRATEERLRGAGVTAARTLEQPGF